MHPVLCGDLRCAQTPEGISRKGLCFAAPPVPSPVISSGQYSSYEEVSRKKMLEARIGVEPTNKGFADLCLTTWLPRHSTIHLADSIDFNIRRTFAVGSQFRFPSPIRPPWSLNLVLRPIPILAPRHASPGSPDNAPSRSPYVNLGGDSTS